MVFTNWYDRGVRISRNKAQVKDGIFKPRKFVLGISLLITLMKKSRDYRKVKIFSRVSLKIDNSSKGGQLLGEGKRCS